MTIFLQQTVDAIFAADYNKAVEYFTSLGIPQIKETANGIKYYVYD